MNQQGGEKLCQWINTDSVHLPGIQRWQCPLHNPVSCHHWVSWGTRGSQPKEKSKMTEEECVGFFPCTWKLLIACSSSRKSCHMPDRKLQCRADRCAQRIQLDCLHIQVLSFYSKSSLYAMQDQNSHLISAVKSWRHRKKAIIGFRHAGDLLGKIIQFSTKTRGCKDPPIPLKASSPPQLGLFLDFWCMFPFCVHREEKTMCGGSYHMKIQVSNHDKSLKKNQFKIMHPLLTVTAPCTGIAFMFKWPDKKRRMELCLQCLLNIDSGASFLSPLRHLDISSLLDSLLAFQAL